MTDLTIGNLKLASPELVTVGTPVTFTVVISNVGDTDVTEQFFVDVFVNPTEVYSTYIPVDADPAYIVAVVFGRWRAHDGNYYGDGWPNGRCQFDLCDG